MGTNTPYTPGPRQAQPMCPKPARASVPEPAPEPDVVRRPAHYARWKIEPITFIMENDLPFYKGNPVKYIVRAGHKLYEGKDAVQSEIIDLEKAARMIEMRLGQLKGEPCF
jgi:hypothetical protein